MKPNLTVVIPSYNPSPELLKMLYESLVNQTFAQFEVILVDDASSEDSAYACIQDQRFRILRQDRNRGPAACRNLGARAASTKYLFFTDTDCELAPDTLQQVMDGLQNDLILIGNTITRVETSFGKAVALLGFPGGGILGFDKVWRVDAHGYTNSFSSCNLAFRKETFESLGGFDETFPVAGGEDTVLARQAVLAQCSIRYLSGIRVYHIEKSGLSGFIHWQITRGRGNYYIKRRVGKVSGYLRLRLWTFRNSLLEAGLLYAFPVIVLIGLSVFCQVIGMTLEKQACKNTRPKSS
jgi:glycosyltransferase involved in cell wall biosynthesis